MKGLTLILFILVSISTTAQIIDSLKIQDSTTLNPITRKIVFNTDTAYSIIDSNSTAQKDSIAPEKKLKKHSPGKAAWMSAVLPGLGQAYNKKYWKIPIIYAGLGGLGYAVYYTGNNFTQARNAYRLQVDGDSSTIGIFQGTTDAATLKVYRDYHKRNLTITGICAGVWYFLNIIDAVVDGHLYNFNVSDKLSIHWEPEMIKPVWGTSAFSGGAKFTLIFK